MRVSFVTLSTISLGILLLAGCQGLPSNEPAWIATEPVMVAPNGPVIVSPTPTMAQPAGVPGFPEPMANAPTVFAGPTPNSGTAIAPQLGLPASETVSSALPNPMKVPVNNHDYAWDQVVDVVADYFPIAYEQRVHIDQQLWTEGRVETPYQVGATLFEPHRKDSVGSFNKWQSTLQTIRRRAVVRVVPEPDGYLIDLQVVRELEDLPQPERATAGAASLRNDSSLPSAARAPVSRTKWSSVWIPLGRDTPLEQKMLAEIRDRLADVPRGTMSVTPTQ
ncbi:hypothetical protein [Aeoliella mucimassa]|uniref:Lipoprotein n=1 Tax=Aeoliella mucimassa TaxID=2527972 RepID=A0A518AI51_9BACT|nr:hypothetical protein [Aeoliella mucimassa]QDU54402.1 hypothetical protein Pan181_05830 [Aeoliella mucimassa]